MLMDGRKSDKSAKFNKYAKKIKGKAWVHKKKEQYRNRGISVANDSKFTGRKRKDRL
jgi:Methyltransferase involved in Williams-Beuren syndrome.